MLVAVSKGKDPRRQLGQYKRMIRQQSKIVRWSWLGWAIPLPFAVAAFWFDWHWFAKVMLVVTVIVGAIGQMNESARLQNYEEDAENARKEAEL